MKAKLFITGKMGGEGIYILRAEGDKVSLSELEVKFLFTKNGWDIFQATKMDRIIKIASEELAWLADGKEYPIEKWELSTI